MSADKPWVDGLTLAKVLAKTVERFGDHDALVFPQLGYRRSYAGFQEDVREAALALLALDIQYGQHIGIWATNWPQWVVLQFAAASLPGIGPMLRLEDVSLLHGALLALPALMLVLAMEIYKAVRKDDGQTA